MQGHSKSKSLGIFKRVFLQVRQPSSHPTNNAKAMKGNLREWKGPEYMKDNCSDSKHKAGHFRDVLRRKSPG